MNKGQKVALKHAANAIEGIRPVGGIKLGSLHFETSCTTRDEKGRPFVAEVLAERAGIAPIANHTDVKLKVAQHYGLTSEQVEKLGKVARSTHNLKQRAERVAAFLRKAAEVEGYVGRQAAL